MNYKLILSFYSPIHIGNGQELEPFEYIIKDDYLYTFSFEQFVSSLSPGDREKLLQLQRNMKPAALKDIRNFIKHRCTLDQYREKIPVTRRVAYIYENKFLDIQNMLKMEPFIKTMGSPYIPGSSLKGAIRTAVLNYWSEEQHRDEHDILKAKKEDKWGKFLPDIGLDVFKFLKLPDIPLPKDFTLFSKISNFHLKDNQLQETNIQLLREVTRSRYYPLKEFAPGGNLFGFELKLDKEIMQDSKAVSGRRDLTFDTIWKSLDFYESILDRESKKWSPYNKNLYWFYENFMKFLKEEREKKGDLKVIKIGFGSGFEAITIEKLRRPKRAYGKSINIFESLCPLGWVVLRRE
jgi:CRISPR-associated protein Csm5